MSRLPERWLMAHWRWRFLSALVVLMLMYGAANTLAGTLWPADGQLQQQRRLLHEQTRQQYQYLRQRAIADAAFIAVPQRPVARPFSALQLSRESRSTLVSWQPDSPHSELILEVNWSQLPSLFTLLGEQHIKPESFMLQMHEQALTLTLRLGDVK
ncbi:hypothetical protein GWD52_03320 [Enterobacteriaceae bacterium 4M9]|nr:hypothetical protein [Enterobacteriaceae bacterium 4M9]